MTSSNKDQRLRAGSESLEYGRILGWRREQEKPDVCVLADQLRTQLLSFFIRREQRFDQDFFEP